MSDQPQRRPAPINTDEEITAANLRRDFDHYDQKFRLMEQTQAAMQAEIDSLKTRVQALESA